MSTDALATSVPRPPPDAGMVNVESGGRRLPAWPSVWPAVLVFLSGLGLALFLWQALTARNGERSDERFRAEARQVNDLIGTRLQVFSNMLLSGAGLFTASREVDIAEWKAFSNAIGVDRYLSTIKGFGYASNRAGRGLDAQEVRFSEPSAAWMQEMFGSNLSLMPELGGAMRATAESGEPRATSVLRHTLDARVNERGIVVMFNAVYRAGMPLDTPENRVAALQGFIFAAFLAHDMVNEAAGGNPPGFDYNVVDLTDGVEGKSVLYSYVTGRLNGLAENTKVLSQTNVFQAGGRIWGVAAVAPPHYGADSQQIQEIGFLAGGVVLSCLGALVAFNLSQTRARALHLAGRMTRDLATSQARFARMVGGTADGVWEFEIGSGNCFLSPRFLELIGFPSVESTQSWEWVIRRIHPEDRAVAVAEFDVMLEAGGGFDRRLRMQMRDGTYRWFRVRGRVFTESGKGTVAGSMSDIHDEQEASFREERLLKIIEMSPDLFMTFDLEGRATYLNAAARRIFGDMASDSLAGFSVSGMFSQSEVDRVFNEGVPTAYMQDHWEGETELITAAGEVLPVSQVILSHKNNAGQVEFYSTVMRDISERRSAMQALTEAQERLQRALDGSSDGIWERDVASDAFATSDRLAEILGYSPEEMPRTRVAWRALNHPDDIPVSDAAVARLGKTNESVVWDTRMRTRSGEYRWMRRRGRMVRDAEGNPLMTAGTLTDIHDSKMAEFSLQDLKARYQRALDGTNDGIWEMDEVARTFYCSPRFCELVGWSIDQAPRTRDDMRNLIHPEDLPHHFASVATMQAKPGAHSWDVRFRDDHGGYRWVRFRGIASRAPDSSLLLTSGTISDIHEARLAEIELRQHRDNLAHLVEERTAGLEQARLDAEASREAAERANLAKSEFLANMSHELRTPMHAIISFANFGVDKSDRAERDKLLHYFRNIQKSGSRLLTLLNDLLDLSKLEAGKMDMTMVPVNAAALLADAIAEAEAFAMNRKVHLVLEADPARLGVVWDGPRILQVIRNLISNAVKFSLAEGDVLISAHPVLLPAGRRAGDPQVPGIEIRVRDAGVGIPEDELESVFDKFVQSSKTKTGAGGTGLGLAICREIILAHQGSIRAENNAAPQPGATFVVLLPVSPSAARQSRDAASIQPHQHLEEMK